MTRRRCYGHVGFPAAPDPTWSAETRERWTDVKAFADAHPGTPGHGGWSVESAPHPAGPMVGLGALVAGEAAGLPVAVHLATTLPGWWRDVAVLALIAPGVWAMRSAWVLGELDARHLRPWHVVRALTGRSLPVQVSGLPGPATWDERYGREVRNTDYRPWDVTARGEVAAPDVALEMCGCCGHATADGCGGPQCPCDDREPAAAEHLADVIPLVRRVAS